MLVLQGGYICLELVRPDTPGNLGSGGFFKTPQAHLYTRDVCFFLAQWGLR